MFVLKLNLAIPGQTNEDVILCIKEALEERGYDLTIVNEFPPHFATLAEEDAWQAKRKAELQSSATGRAWSEKYPEKPTKIKFTVEHCPWGG